MGKRKTKNSIPTNVQQTYQDLCTQVQLGLLSINNIKEGDIYFREKSQRSLKKIIEFLAKKNGLSADVQEEKIPTTPTTKSTPPEFSFLQTTMLQSAINNLIVYGIDIMEYDEDDSASDVMNELGGKVPYEYGKSLTASNNPKSKIACEVIGKMLNNEIRVRFTSSVSRFRTQEDIKHGKDDNDGVNLDGDVVGKRDDHSAQPLAEAHSGYCSFTGSPYFHYFMWCIYEFMTNIGKDYESDAGKLYNSINTSVLGKNMSKNDFIIDKDMKVFLEDAENLPTDVLQWLNEYRMIHVCLADYWMDRTLDLQREKFYRSIGMYYEEVDCAKILDLKNLHYLSGWLVYKVCKTNQFNLKQKRKIVLLLSVPEISDEAMNPEENDDHGEHTSLSQALDKGNLHFAKKKWLDVVVALEACMQDQLTTAKCTQRGFYQKCCDIICGDEQFKLKFKTIFPLDNDTPDNDTCPLSIIIQKKLKDFIVKLWVRFRSHVYAKNISKKVNGKGEFNNTRDKLKVVKV